MFKNEKIRVMSEKIREVEEILMKIILPHIPATIRNMKHKI